MSVNGSPAETRYVYLTKTPVDSNDYQYDADGNLTRDGRWTYSYNAENRLIEMVPLAGMIKMQNEKVCGR